MDKLIEETITFNCPSCDVYFELGSEYYNSKCQCTSCGIKFFINRTLLNRKGEDKKIVETQNKKKIQTVKKPSIKKASKKSTAPYRITALAACGLILAFLFLIRKPAAVIVNKPFNEKPTATPLVNSKKMPGKKPVLQHASDNSKKNPESPKPAVPKSKAGMTELLLPVKKIPNLEVPKPDSHPVEWANAGIIGQIGVIAQRGIGRREYKILVIEEGSPADGKLLPGDHIIGVDGNEFQPEEYDNCHPSAIKYSSYMEPNRAMGRALDEAAEFKSGKLTLTVKRQEQKGTVLVQLPAKTGFSKTFPWNCSKSEQLVSEIAENFMKETLPYKRDLYATVWYGLFLLNYDSQKYRQRIDEIVKLLLMHLPNVHNGSLVKGIRGGTSTWHTALYGMFLAEYAMTTGQQKKMNIHLQQIVAQLFDARMKGNLWGHHKSHNYGRLTGGFMGASSQASLALICLQEAGANISQDAMDTALNGISASIKRTSGQVGYGSPDDASWKQPFDWTKINKDNTHLGAESLMRQSTVMLSMLFSGRKEETKAANKFAERMIFSHATHGISPDWGVHEAVRAFASVNPEACRKMLDTYRYRINLSLHWKGGMQLIPYRNRKDEEYSPGRFRVDRFGPAIWGLIFSVHKKKLFMLSKVSNSAKSLSVSTSSAQTLKDSYTVRNLTCGNGKIFYVSSSVDNLWGVYEYDSKSAKRTLIKGSFKYTPHEMKVWNGKLYFSVKGCELWVWDGKKALLLQKLRNHRYAACQFTPFKGKLYFAAPPQIKEMALGGELWVTDGTKAGTKAVDKKTGLLLGGSTSWQTHDAHAESMKVAAGKLLFVSCIMNEEKKPDYTTFKMWAFDGVRKTEILNKRTDILTVDNMNSYKGSYLGLEYKGKLYFKCENKLWETDGTSIGTRPCNFKMTHPNNLSIFNKKLIFSGTENLVVKQGNKKRRIKAERLVLFDGSKTNTIETQAVKIRQITSTGNAFYYIGFSKENGYELHTGNEESTALLKDINPGPSGSIISNLISVKNRLYFSASDGKSGSEFWTSDGSATGTKMFDLLPGPQGSIPDSYRFDANRIIFYTNSEVKDRKIWTFKTQ